MQKNKMLIILMMTYCSVSFAGLFEFFHSSNNNKERVSRDGNRSSENIYSIDLNKSISEINESVVRMVSSINTAEVINEEVAPPKAPCLEGEKTLDESHEDRRSVIVLNSEDEKHSTLEEKEILVSESKKVEPVLDESVTDVLRPKEELKDDLRTRIIKNYIKLKGDPISIKQALCFFDKYKNKNFIAKGDPSRAKKGIEIGNEKYITINDLNKSYFESRLFQVNMETGEVKVVYSSHGIAGRKGVQDNGSYAFNFSNLNGSYATPRGFFITGSRKNSSSDPRWKFSLLLHGVQRGVNDHSFERDIILHSFPDVNNAVADSNEVNPVLEVSAYDDFTLSKGCTMVGEKVANKLINELKAKNSAEGGSLYYNYTWVEKERGENYCGEENLMMK